MDKSSELSVFFYYNKQTRKSPGVINVEQTVQQDDLMTINPVSDDQDENNSTLT